MIDDTGFFVGSVAVVVAAIEVAKFGTKVWWKRWQQQELEQFKIEHREVFTRLHERRANAIEEIYTQLVETFEAFQVFMAPMGSGGEAKEKERDDAAKHARTLLEVCRPRMIYLSPDVAARLNSFNDVLKLSWIEYLTSASKTQGGGFEHWAGWKTLEEGAKPAKELIENDFRGVLGIEQSGTRREAAKLWPKVLLAGLLSVFLLYSHFGLPWEHEITRYAGSAILVIAILILLRLEGLLEREG